MGPDVPLRYLGEGRYENAARLWSAGNAHPYVLALQPLALLYNATVRARRAAYNSGLAHAERVSVPVISVGNLTVGGSGKTPVAGWLLDQLQRMGHTPALLHGGYANDEPELHRRWRPNVPVFAAKDRLASARTAIARGATVLVLDDGFQHLRLARELDIVLIPADSWGAPHRLLPAGPWREPLSALRRGGAIVITRKAADISSAQQVRRGIAPIAGNTPIAIAHLAITSFAHNGTSGRIEGSAVAVCGIGDPGAFGRQLAGAGVQLEEVLAFPDHHEFNSSDLAAIQRAAQGRELVTTEKDAVKLHVLDPALDVWIARQTVLMEEGEAELLRALEQAAPR